MQHLLLIPERAPAPACLAMPFYDPAKSEHGQSCLSRQVKTGRYRVTCKQNGPIRTRKMARCGAAEMTGAGGRDGFEITNQTTRRSGGLSIRVGAGISIGLPRGSGRPSGKAAGIINVFTGVGHETDQSEARDVCFPELNLRFQAS